MSRSLASRPYQPSAGFSLVELSIVLVILGLLVGGVLVGQTLIKSAELRAQMDQVKSFQTGINTFRLKYDGLPGDIDNATQMFLASEWPNIENGNGNEKIADADDSDDDFTGEVSQFWMQLGAAKMVSGTYDGTNAVDQGFPSTALGRGGVIAIYDPKVFKDNVFYIGVDDGKPANDDIVGMDALTPSEAAKIDEKFDDGHPLFGSVVARSGGSTSYNGTADYNSPDAPVGANPMPAFAEAIFDLLVPSAHAYYVTDVNEACILMEGDGTTTASEESAYYHQSNPIAICQLMVKMD